MAFTLTLPLVGLEPKNFSALSTKLQCEAIEYEPLSVSELNSSNTTDDSNEASGSDESKSQSTKSNSSVDSERQRKEKESQQPRVMHEGRDVLNLGANIRDPVWKSRDMWNGGYESTSTNRSIVQRMHEQTHTQDQSTRSCPDCKFREPKPYLH